MVVKRKKPILKKKQALKVKRAVKNRATLSVKVKTKTRVKRSGSKTKSPTIQKDISYNPGAIEARWQSRWEKDKLYLSVIHPGQPKHYALTMLPYTSGDLHFGHWYPMAPPEARARFKRMNGYNVLFPIGFDRFGLPAENAAIKRGIHPKDW